MSAVRPPTLWLSVAAAAISVVAVAVMVSSTGPRRPLTFAGALLPHSHSSATSHAPGGTTHAARPGTARTAAPTSATPSSAAPSSRISPPEYQPPVYQAPVPAVIPAQNIPSAQHTAGAENNPATQHTVRAPSRTPGQSSPPSSPSTTRTPVSTSPLPTGGSPTAVPSTPAPEPSPTALAQALFSALNDARKLAGLPSLRWSAGLQRSAAGHDEAMAAADQLASQVGDEPALGVRQADQGVVASFSAEALGCVDSIASTDGAVSADALAVQQQMLAEQPPDDSRRQTLLSTAVNAVGIDVLLDPAHGRLWVTEDFARLS